jgi:hypothetical protein
MISVGYMAKCVSVRPEWMKAERVADIYSVSGCVSKDFADYINYWKHNGYWFFDSPEIILQLGQQNSIDLTGTRLFFYEAHELEFDDVENQWTSFKPEPSFPTHVVVPIEKVLEGYDVVSFSGSTGAECSPLSCNSLATEVETNQHCLLAVSSGRRNCWRRVSSKTRSQGPIGYLVCIRRSGPSPPHAPDQRENALAGDAESISGAHTRQALGAVGGDSGIHGSEATGGSRPLSAREIN